MLSSRIPNGLLFHRHPRWRPKRYSAKSSPARQVAQQEEEWILSLRRNRKLGPRRIQPQLRGRYGRTSHSPSSTKFSRETTPVLCRDQGDTKPPHLKTVAPFPLKESGWTFVRSRRHGTSTLPSTTVHEYGYRIYIRGGPRPIALSFCNKSLSSYRFRFSKEPRPKGGALKTPKTIPTGKPDVLRADGSEYIS